MATDDDTPTLKLDWSAYHRRGAEAVELVVEGSGSAPTSGWTAELVRREPQGFNPEVLQLVFVEHRPTGPVTQVQTPITVCYVEAVRGEGEFQTVEIMGIAQLPIRAL
jgi:hypothetical protein